MLWRTGLRIGEALALEWRDLDYAGRSSRRCWFEKSKTGSGRTVPLHGDLVRALRQLAGSPRSPGQGGGADPPDGATAHTRRDSRQLDLDDESPGTGVQKAGAHSLRHSAARHWLTTAGVPLNVVSQWLGHASPLVTLRTYLVISGSVYSMDNVP